MSDEIYLNLDIKTLEETKEQAKQRDINDSGKDAHGYKYPNINFNVDSLEIEEETIELMGDMTDVISGKSLGYISIKITPDLDTIIELIQVYMKKLGKLKTILEATK